jgi:hypothetical protein
VFRAAQACSCSGAFGVGSRVIDSAPVEQVTAWLKVCFIAKLPSLVWVCQEGQSMKDAKGVIGVKGTGMSVLAFVGV